MTKMSHSLEQLSGTATRKNPAPDPLQGDEFSHLSDDELMEGLRERMPKLDLLPAKRRANQRRPRLIRG
jgi:hypothetical protein